MCDHAADDTRAGAPDVELLAPAGDPDAGYAALHHGADAVYLGLGRFSARAKATNFTPEELSELAAWAHALSPRRRVFAAVNTLVRQHELAALIEALALLADCGVDAVIVQDLGVARIVRTYFPRIELHASTQLAVHNLAGAEALGALGFTRVTLARELTLDEIRAISAAAPVQSEVFIHGALCYSYSGLCLYSALLRQRSGNRGECTYPCRELFTAGGEDRGALPFSMKDLALPARVQALRKAGVACVKIEGRMKSALYVAAATSLYRAALDGAGGAGEREELAADVRTVFSRPWTALYLDGRGARDVTDRETVGHRGDPIGVAEELRRIGRGGPWLCFTTAAAIERHDGIQVDLPGREKPYGFPVKALRLLDSRGGAGRTAFEAPAGARVAVALPDDAPPVPEGAPVYQASSQRTKRSYPFARPRPGDYKARLAADVSVRVSPDGLHGEATACAPALEQGPAAGRVCARHTAPAPLAPARKVEGLEAAARGVFEKLGATEFSLGRFEWENPDGLFVPVSALNAFRRSLMAELGARVREARAARIEAIAQEVCRVFAPPATPAAPTWALKTDRLAHCEAFEAGDWDAAAEVIIDIGNEPLDALRAWLGGAVAARLRDRIRLALPAIVRAWDEKDLRGAIASLRNDGWTRWEAANIGGLRLLASCGGGEALDCTADWPLYAVNRMAAAEILAMGMRRVTLSPEDSLANMRSLLAEFGDRAEVLVYQDVPLFISETCVRASLRGDCPGAARCDFTEMALVSSSGERVRAVNRRCRSVTIGERAFSIAHRARELAAWGAARLRADFVWRAYAPEDVRERWRALRGGARLPDTHEGNAK